MNAPFRYISRAGILLICLSLFSGSIASAAVSIKKNTNTGTFSVTLTDPSTKAVTIVKSGTEKNRGKVVALCRTYIKTQKNFGIKCVWNNTIVFSKKVIIKKGSVVKPTTPATPATTTPATTTPTNEAKTFDGYIDGRIVLTNANVTKEKATATCSLMKTANPKSEIMCRWGDVDMGTQLAQSGTSAISVELAPSSIAGPTNTYLTRNMELEIGRFSLKSNSGDTDTKLSNIIFTQVGSARLRTLVDSSSNARIIDIESGKEIYANTTISDTDIVFGNMDELLLKGSTRHFKIILGLNALENIADGSTVALSLDPSNIKILKKTDLTSRVLLLGGVLKLPTLSIGKIPPKLTVTNVNESTFRIRVTNSDENYPLTVTQFIVSSYLTLPSGQSYIAKACIRGNGSTNACGTEGTSALSIPIPGSNQTISIAGSSVYAYTEKNGGYLDFELFTSSENIFPSGSQIDIIVEGITYTLDGKTFTEKYPGSTTARATYHK